MAGTLQAMRKQGMSDAELAKPASMESVLTLVDMLTKAINRNTDRVKGIQTKGVEYRGVFQSAQEYGRGDLVTFAGSMWHANCATRTKPGDGRDWTLAVKGAQR